MHVRTWSSIRYFPADYWQYADDAPMLEAIGIYKPFPKWLLEITYDVLRGHSQLFLGRDYSHVYRLLCTTTWLRRQHFYKVW